jgi:hypothetical protein
MASFNFTSPMLDEGTTFIFGSWICIANGLGGFNSHLADSRKPEASTPTQCNDIDKFVDNFDELLLPDHVSEIEMASFLTSIAQACREYFFSYLSSVSDPI